MDAKEDIINFGPGEQLDMYKPLYDNMKGRLKLFSGVALHILGETPMLTRKIYEKVSDLPCFLNFPLKDENRFQSDCLSLSCKRVIRYIV